MWRFRRLFTNLDYIGVFARSARACEPVLHLPLANCSRFGEIRHFVTTITGGGWVLCDVSHRTKDGPITETEAPMPIFNEIIVTKKTDIAWDGGKPTENLIPNDANLVFDSTGGGRSASPHQAPLLDELGSATDNNRDTGGSTDEDAGLSGGSLAVLLAIWTSPSRSLRPLVQYGPPPAEPGHQSPMPGNSSSYELRLGGGQLRS